MKTLTLDDVQSAVDRLSQSGRGQQAMQGLLNWLEESGIGLDEGNQQAVLTLLTATWGPFTGSAREAMRAALEA